jgi:D-sedoheptulose 7-phosphate isomerase
MDFMKYKVSVIHLIEQLSIEKVEEIAKEIRMRKNRAHKVYICGNGGSASTAEHLAQDLFKSCDVNAISLVSNTSSITAYGNDDGYDNIFAKQLKFACSDDLLIVFSGSGNSKNVIESIKAFKGTKIGILGYDGGKAKAFCDISLVIESFDMQHCEDMHMIVTHMLMKYLGGKRC